MLLFAASGPDYAPAVAFGRKVWQLGTGDPARSYWPYMQANEVALIGPGDAGKYPDPRYDDEPAVRHFAEAPTGDIVVARRGSREALGIGVLGPYKWSTAFDDVEGWNLQHYRRVRWWEPPDGPKQFKGRPFARSRFTVCHSPEVDQWVERVRTRQQLRSPRSYKKLPSAKPDMAKSALSGPLRRVVRQAEFLQERWMSGQMGRTSTEAELLTHITVPLLEALGWAPEQIAVGWEYTDLALFNDPPFPREPANCRVVIEGKRIGSGLDWRVIRRSATSGIWALPGRLILS